MDDVLLEYPEKSNNFRNLILWHDHFRTLLRNYHAISLDLLGSPHFLQFKIDSSKRQSYFWKIELVAKTWKKGKKSSRYALFTLCWLMTLRKETGNARLNLSLTYYACPVKKTWPLLNYTHQKSLEEESSCRSSESTRQFPRLRRGNVSSLTFDKLFVWIKREKPPHTLRIWGMQR